MRKEQQYKPHQRKELKIMKEKEIENRANEKVLADFRKLSTLDKYKECIRYGNNISTTGVNTKNGWLTFKAFEIYGAKFIFIVLGLIIAADDDIKACYELQ